MGEIRRIWRKLSTIKNISRLRKKRIIKCQIKYVKQSVDFTDDCVDEIDAAAETMP